MLHDRLTRLIFVVSVLVFLFVVELVRRRKLAEQYSLLWLAASFAMVSLSFSFRGLKAFARALGIVYAPSALFAVGMLALVAIVLHFSVVLSRLGKQSRDAAQRIALLERRLEEEGRSDEDGGPEKRP